MINITIKPFYMGLIESALITQFLLNIESQTCINC